MKHHTHRLVAVLVVLGAPAIVRVPREVDTLVMMKTVDIFDAVAEAAMSAVGAVASNRRLLGRPLASCACLYRHGSRPNMCRKADTLHNLGPR